MAMIRIVVYIEKFEEKITSLSLREKHWILKLFKGLEILLEPCNNQ